MNDINMFTCIGRLTRDPELKYTPNGKATAKFGVAVNKSYYNSEGEKIETPLFLNVVTWNKTAENAEKFLHKGSKVALQGSLQSHNWEDKDGRKRTSFEMVAFMVQFLDDKKIQKEETEEPMPEEVEKMVDKIGLNTEIPF